MDGKSIAVTSSPKQSQCRGRAAPYGTFLDGGVLVASATGSYTYARCTRLTLTPGGGLHPTPANPPPDPSASTTSFPLPAIAYDSGQAGLREAQERVHRPGSLLTASWPDIARLGASPARSPRKSEGRPARVSVSALRDPELF